MSVQLTTSTAFLLDLFSKSFCMEAGAGLIDIIRHGVYTSDHICTFLVDG